MNKNDPTAYGKLAGCDGLTIHGSDGYDYVMAYIDGWEIMAYNDEPVEPEDTAVFDTFEETRDHFLELVRDFAEWEW